MLPPDTRAVAVVLVGTGSIREGQREAAPRLPAPRPPGCYPRQIKGKVEADRETASLVCHRQEDPLDELSSRPKVQRRTHARNDIGSRGTRDVAQNVQSGGTGTGQVVVVEHPFLGRLIPRQTIALRGAEALKPIPAEQEALAEIGERLRVKDEGILKGPKPPTGRRILRYLLWTWGQARTNVCRRSGGRESRPWSLTTMPLAMLAIPVSPHPTVRRA